MEKNSIADYFADEGEMGHIGFLSKELSKEIDARLADLQIVDELADPVLDASLLEKCRHDNDQIIGTIYSAQSAISEVIDLMRRRPVFAEQQL